LGKLEPHVISQLAVDDMVVVVEAHVMKTKINMGCEHNLYDSRQATRDGQTGGRSGVEGSRRNYADGTD
jgi:hypothetical protein